MLKNMSRYSSFTNHPGMEVKDAIKRQGNKGMCDLLRPPTIPRQTWCSHVAFLPGPSPRLSSSVEGAGHMG